MSKKSTNYELKINGSLQAIPLTYLLPFANSLKVFFQPNTSANKVWYD